MKAKRRPPLWTRYFTPSGAIASWLAIGIGIGAAMGAATDSMAIWVAIGAGVGVAIGAVIVGLRRTR